MKREDTVRLKQSQQESFIGSIFMAKQTNTMRTINVRQDKRESFLELNNPNQITIWILITRQHTL